MKVLSIWKGAVDRPMSQMEIAEFVADKHRITVDEIRLNCRMRGYAWPRHEAMYMMAIEVRPDGIPRWSYSQIGAFFGQDHSSAIDGVQGHCARNGFERPRRAIGGWKMAG